MDASVATLSSLYLAVLSTLGLFHAYRLAAQSGTIFSARPLLMLNFVIVYPISGIIHLLELGPNRGYFDLLHTSPEHIYNACLAATIAFSGLAWGMGREPVSAQKAAVFDRHWDKYDTSGMLVVVLLVGPLSLYGLTIVQAVVEDAQTTRNITLATGNARFVFLSQWFPWVITMAAAFFIAKTRNVRPVYVLAVLAAASIVIIWSVRWSGGRSIIIVFVMPILIYAWPYLKGLRVASLLIGSALLFSYILLLSQERQDSYVAGQETNILSWLDWEWGRFSMVGLAMTFTDHIRMLFGESILNGISNTLNPLTSLIGIQFNTDGYLSSLNVASVVLIGSYDFKHIVPGLTAEMYMNFGLAGVGAAYFLLGWFARFIDRKLSDRCYGLTRLFLYYILALVAFRVMVGESHILLFYILFPGLPLTLVAWITSVVAARSRRAAAKKATASVDDTGSVPVGDALGRAGA